LYAREALKAFDTLATRLRGNASEQAARAVLELLQQRRSHVATSA
jgi:hypothetical protein